MQIASAVAEANTLLAATLIDSVSIEQRSEASDGAGGTAVSFGAGSSYAARVHAPGGAAAISTAGAAVERSADVYVVVLATTAAVAEGDRITWGDVVMYATKVRRSSTQIGTYVEAVAAP